MKGTGNQMFSRRSFEDGHPLRGVILDIDGTLLDSNDAHAKAWQKVLNEEGFKVSYEDVRPLIGMGGDKLLPLLSKIPEDSNRGRRISKQRGQLFKIAYLPQLRPFPGTRDLLLAMKEGGLKLAVATSASRDDLKGLLKAAGIEDLLEVEVTSSDADRSKPDGDIVKAALWQLGLSPAEALMLGDTPYDIESARRNGVATVALRCGGWKDHDLEGALAVYDNPQDLLVHIAQSPFGVMGSKAA